MIGEGVTVCDPDQAPLERLQQVSLEDRDPKSDWQDSSEIEKLPYRSRTAVYSPTAYTGYSGEDCQNKLFHVSIIICIYY